MVDINNVIKIAKQKEASTIHLICGMKPILRILGDLVQIEDMNILEEEDIYEIYDYFMRGNVDKDAEFKKTRKLDILYENSIRVNMSYTNEIPTYTLKLIEENLPEFEELGIPDIVKSVINKTQGLILVTGKEDSGKRTTLNVLVDEINQTQNKKIIMLESLLEYKHKSKKSIVVQKEIGVGRDCLTFEDAIKNSIKEDTNVLVVEEVKDKETMDNIIEIAETGRLVIASLNSRTCAETVERIINFYPKEEQNNVKYLLSSLLKLVISQRMLKDKNEKSIFIPEVMLINNSIASIIRKDYFDATEIEEIIQNSPEKGNISLIDSIAKLFLKDKITLEQAKTQIDEKNIETLNRTIMQLKIKK